MPKTDFKSIEEYVSTFPPETQKKLREVWKIIKSAIPKEAKEAISYQIPTFKLNGNLVHFAAGKNHIGFYPAPSGIAAFSEEFDKLGYKWSKGAVQFPLNAPLPADLISRIVKFRVEENLTL